MSEEDDKPGYEALAVPNEAQERGGVEILRAGLMSDELYVAARAAFDDPGMWGEVLADITRRLARLYAAEGKFTHKDALSAIEGAYAADLGAPIVAPRRKKTTLGKSRRKSGGKRGAKSTAKSTAKANARARKSTKRKAR